MALDTVTVSALAEELSARLTDGRIEKIQQPEKDLLLLTIRAEGENRKLLIRAAGPNSRVHLTEQSFENPKEAPMFCMLLRKYLTGARIRSVEQPNGDRLIAFRLSTGRVLCSRDCDTNCRRSRRASNRRIRPEMRKRIGVQPRVISSTYEREMQQYAILFKTEKQSKH